MKVPKRFSMPLILAVCFLAAPSSSALAAAPASSPTHKDVAYDTDVSGDETRAKRLISSTDQSVPATKATGPVTVRVAAVQAKRRLIDWHISNPAEALAAFDRLRSEYRGSWIDRVAAERLHTLRHPKDQETR